MKTLLCSFWVVLFLSFNSFAQDSLAVKDTITTASGLKYIVITKGTGEKAEAGKQVEVNYTGYLTDGNIFDSSIKRGVPFDFILGEGKVIRGWDEGIIGMKKGGKRTLTVPHQYGYGKYGAGEIPGFATLMFDIELLDIT